ncbi:MAG: CRISPR-associated endonuclease Cas2 [Nanoarchaeota archaeon]|nr:CRISPR-associated endonuclease Cas2 [Nanoarchaeota archaeon]
MKIKLPFTEKFLWDLYNFKNKAGSVINKILPEKYGPHFLSFNIFRDEWTNENKKKYEKEKSRKRFTWLIRRLRQEGYLKVLKIKNESAIVITSKGMDRVFKTKLKLIDKKSRKDGKWQMVWFDIPENKRRYRDYFRKTLQYLGYQKLQKSIWVCKYDVGHETKELIKRYALKEYVELLLIQKIGLG